MRINRDIFLRAILLAAVFSGCGPTVRNGDRQSRFGSGLLLSGRVIILPAADKALGTILFVAEMRYADLQFVKTSSGYTAELELTFALKDKARPEQVRLVDRRRKIDLKDFAETVDRDQILRVMEQMVVPAGEYIASIAGTDRYARSQGLISQALLVNDFLSDFSLSEPILTLDSVTVFQPDKLIPLRQHRFAKDFYALLVIGGLQTGREVVLRYELQDAEGKRQFNDSTRFSASKPTLYTSLRIPVANLAMGTTMLKVTAEHEGAKANVSLSIYANVGFSPRPGQSLAALIEPMRYVMDEKDWHALKAAAPDERVKIFNEFWAARQPLKGEDENPLLAEFFLRVQEANSHFHWGTLEGWRTDRGRIFIIFGEPDGIQRQQQMQDQAMLEIWTYAEIGRRFVFQDYNNDGDFRLISGG